MARYQPEMPDDFGDRIPENWSDREAEMWWGASHLSDSWGLTDNHHAQDLFHTGLFDDNATPDERHDAREELRDEFAEKGLDFDFEFDWAGWREDHGYKD